MSETLSEFVTEVGMKVIGHAATVCVFGESAVDGVVEDFLSWIAVDDNNQAAMRLFAFGSAAPAVGARLALTVAESRGETVETPDDLWRVVGAEANLFGDDPSAVAMAQAMAAMARNDKEMARDIIVAAGMAGNPVAVAELASAAVLYVAALFDVHPWLLTGRREQGAA